MYSNLCVMYSEKSASQNTNIFQYTFLIHLTVSKRLVLKSIHEIKRRIGNHQVLDYFSMQALSLCQRSLLSPISMLP